jgi:hypothetical protein
MMQWWEKLVRYFYNRALAEQLKLRKAATAITNLADAKTVGILYDSTNPSNDIIITKFAEQLRNNGKQVEILAYINDPKIESKADIALFNKKAVSWSRVPQSDKAKQFAAKTFDLLLCCFTEENLPLEFISATSNAKWRVGAYSSNKTHCYDFMIQLGGKTDLQYFITQSTEFLNKIHYDTAKA